MKHEIEFDYWTGKYNPQRQFDYWTGKNNPQRYAEGVVYDGF